MPQQPQHPPSTAGSTGSSSSAATTPPATSSSDSYHNATTATAPSPPSTMSTIDGFATATTGVSSPPRRTDDDVYQNVLPPSYHATVPSSGAPLRNEGSAAAAIDPETSHAAAATSAEVPGSGSYYLAKAPTARGSFRGQAPPPSHPHQQLLSGDRAPPPFPSDPPSSVPSSEYSHSQTSDDRTARLSSPDSSFAANTATSQSHVRSPHKKRKSHLPHHSEHREVLANSQRRRPDPSSALHDRLDGDDGISTDGSYSTGASVSASAASVKSKILNKEVAHRYTVVVAIDFGTAFSGYAFCFTKDATNVQVMRKWEGGDPGVVNMKVPTVLLMSPDEQFHSFGFAARDYFHDLDPRESRNWLYFDRFKMALHHRTDLCIGVTIPAANGVEVEAIKVFSHSIRFFYEHALYELKDQLGREIEKYEIRWVLTVPAIWKQPAKQFMREAATRAGMVASDPNQLLIALEPEAASIYIRKLRMHQLIPERNRQLQKTPIQKPLTVNLGMDLPDPPNLHPAVSDAPSTEPVRYMVCDCGGGTVDITVHELCSDSTLKELYKASGGPHGSVGVDMEFESLLTLIFGEEFMHQFKTKRPAGYVDLMIAFESRKRCASPFKTNPLNVSLPFSFIDFYKKTKGHHVDSAIKKYNKNYDNEVTYSNQGFLRLTQAAMRQLFEPIIVSIVSAVNNVIDHPNCKSVQFLFLVGGFAESPILQHTLRENFSHLLKVIIPQDMTLTILKGAVLFGLDPSIVMCRRSHLTYGVGILNRFVEGKHPPSKRIVKDSIAWCSDVFDQFVTIDQPVTVGNSVVRSYTPAKPGQKVSVISVYCTERPGAQFITDPGVRKCGTLCLDLRGISDEALPKRREIRTIMEFGDTEIKVSALDVTTGRCVLATIDFLNK